MVLTNAVHFLGQWKSAFNVSRTAKANFTLLSGDQVKVDMMHHPNVKLRYGHFENFQMVELPYEGDDVSMLVLLPHVNSKSGLQKVQRERVDELHN